MNSYPFQILAFGFLSPWLLWGLALGSVPVIVHLLHKRKFRETSWAAMRFLLEAARKHSRRIRLEQLILLAVRVLILVLLALALAEPFVESIAFQTSTTVPTHRILVIDTSFSMGHQPAESSRFDLAKSAARKIVSSAKRGDAFNLVQITGSAPQIVVREPSYQRAEFLSEIENLQLTDEPGELSATLLAIGELLDKAPQLKRKEIFFLSDFQRASWAPNSDASRTQIFDQLKALAENAQLMLIDLGSDPAPNAAVTSFSSQESLAIVNRPIPLQVVLQKFDGVGITQRSLELYVDGRFAERQQVQLIPNTETQANFTYTFQSGGEHQLEVRLDGDSLAADDSRWLSLPVRESLNVLLVNGKPAGRPSQRATYYVEQALSPSDDYAQQHNLIHVRVISDGELTGVDLSDIDCIFLCNVAMFTQRETNILTAFAKNGGGLIFALGDEVNADNYNRFLYSDGEGILPARIKDRVGNARNPSQAFLFDLDDLSHPMINPFEGNPNTGLERTLTFTYFAVEEPEKGSQRVVLRFESGDPAIIEAPLGQGRTILLTTSLDDRWNTWSTLGGASLVPVLHETVNFAVAGRWKKRRRLVGDAILRTLPGDSYDAAITMRSPDGKRTPVHVSVVDNFARFSYEETTQRGIYELELGRSPSRVELFAVNVDPRESRLKKVSEDDLKSDLFAGVDFAYRTGWQDFHRDEAATASQAGSLTRWLLIATFCLIFVEQLMAWRFFYGFLLLYCFVAIAFVRYTFAWNTAVGILMLLVLAAGFAVLLANTYRNSTRNVSVSLR
ncbi:MAG: BatA domain-containing protein [Planctomycetes bacterium]|nr:BatA domain-containing protein [Planctomycetota bacterium]